MGTTYKKQFGRKCHNCNGQGFVECSTFKTKCLYCKGKGYRISYYGPDHK